MFERFSGEAPQAVVHAHEEALRMGHGFIGCEHLLPGLVDVGTGPVADALAAFGLRAEGLRRLVAEEIGLGGDPLDASALASLGIDLDAVRRATEASFGPGAPDRGRACGRGPRAGRIPFTPRAKKSLELAGRATVRMRQKSLTSGHVLLGIIGQGSNAALLVLRRLVCPSTRSGRMSPSGSPRPPEWIFSS